jgi:PST family polysaccharide transporter
MSLVVPITVACALFADDIVLVLLGPQWTDTTPIFRLLTPVILGFAVANPLTWLMLATGRAARCARIAVLVSSALVLSYAIGLPYGPHGVAIGFSITIVLSVLPVLHWATRGTLITMGDIVRAIAPSAVSITLAAAVAVVALAVTDRLEPTFLRLVAECTVLFGTYLFTLFFVMKQKAVYVDLLQDSGLWGTARPETAGRSL